MATTLKSLLELFGEHFSVVAILEPPGFLSLDMLLGSGP
jgi:hypothetical protein